MAEGCVAVAVWLVRVLCGREVVGEGWCWVGW